MYVAQLVVSVVCFQILTDISIPVELDNREQLVQSASTSLNSKVVFQQSSLLAPLAVNAVLKIVDPGNSKTQLHNIFLYCSFWYCFKYVGDDIHIDIIAEMSALGI